MNQGRDIEAFEEDLTDESYSSPFIYSKPKLKKKKRSCLRCDREFMSSSKENRICPRCTEVLENYSHIIEY